MSRLVKGDLSKTRISWVKARPSASGTCQGGPVCPSGARGALRRGPRLASRCSGTCEGERCVCVWPREASVSLRSILQASQRHTLQCALAAYCSVLQRVAAYALAELAALKAGPPGKPQTGPPPSESARYPQPLGWSHVFTPWSWRQRPRHCLCQARVGRSGARAVGRSCGAEARASGARGAVSRGFRIRDTG
jgi:hypothetical protein